MKSMKKFLFVAVAMMAMSTTNVNAETTQSNDVYLSTIYVNEQVTTHLIMPETIRLVDISTDTIVGNQVNDNIVRLKPKGAMQDYEQAGIPPRFSPPAVPGRSPGSRPPEPAPNPRDG